MKRLFLIIFATGLLSTTVSSQYVFEGRTINSILINTTGYHCLNAAPMFSRIAPDSYKTINQEEFYFPFELGKNMVAAKDFLPISSPVWVKDNNLSEIVVSLHKYSKGKVSDKIMQQDTYTFDEKGRLTEHVFDKGKMSFNYSYDDDDQLIWYASKNLKKGELVREFEYEYRYNDKNELVWLEKTVQFHKAGKGALINFTSGTYTYNIAYNESGQPVEMYVARDSVTDYFKSMITYTNGLITEENICSRLYQNTWYNTDSFDSIMCSPKYVYEYDADGFKKAETGHYPIMAPYVGYVKRSKPVASSTFSSEDDGLIDCTTEDFILGSTFTTKYRWNEDGYIMDYARTDSYGTITNRLKQQFDNHGKMFSKMYYGQSNELLYGYKYIYDDQGRISQILSISTVTRQPDKVFLFNYISK